MKKSFLILAILLAALFSTLTVYALREFTYLETGAVDISVKATDADKEKLTYSFSKPLTQEGTWQTSYGDAGEYNITITVSDQLASVSETVKLIIKKKEEAPTISSFSPLNETVSLNEGSSLKFMMNATDKNNDSLSFQWYLDEEKVSEKSFFDYMPSYTSDGKHAIEATVSDGTLSTKAHWTVNVIDMDRPAQFHNLVSRAVNEGEFLEIVLNATDPEGDKITYSAEGAPEEAKLSDSVFEWNIGYDTVTNEGVLTAIAKNLHVLTKTFPITFIAESKGLRARQTIKILAKDINRPPIIQEISPITVNEWQIIAISPVVEDPDGDAVSIKYSGFMSKESYQTTYKDAGKYSVTVTASDGFLSSSQVINISINDVKKEPIFSEISDKAVHENETLEFMVDSIDPEGGFVNITGDRLPLGSSFKRKLFRWTPGFDEVTGNVRSKSLALTFIAGSGNAQATKEVVIKVINKDRAPEIAQVYPQYDRFTVKKGSKFQFIVNATDPDGDALKYAWQAGLFESYESSTGVLYRTYKEAGQKTMKVIVSDGELPDSYEWELLVK